MTIEPWAVGVLLFAAITHALWNAIVKASGNRLFTMTTIMATSGVMFAPLIFVYAPPAPESWPFLIASSVIHVAYYTALILAYRHGDLSIAYPVARGTAPLLVAVGAWIFADQILTPLAVLGVLLTSGGISMLAFEKQHRHGDLFKALFSAFMVSLLIAAYTVVDGMGLRRTPEAMAYISWLFFIDGIPLIAYVLFRHAAAYRTYIQARWKVDIAGGLLSGVAYALVLYVLAFSGMAQVSALRETSVLFAVIIGAVTLHERFGALRWIAAVVVTVGVITIQIGS